MFYMFALCSLALFFVYGILGNGNTTIDHFRHLLFAVVSVGTSTGFASHNLVNYGGFFVFILLIVGVIGGCTGSTSGGIKVFRVQVFYKILKHHFLKILYPHLVANIKCDGRDISESLTQSVVILVMLYFLFLMFSTLIVTVSGFDLSEAISVSVAILSNGGMIATEYGSSTSIISNMPQYVRGSFTLLMILGRLEFIAVLVIIIQFFKRT
jgi:trk system potassium uptake protein